MAEDLRPEETPPRADDELLWVSITEEGQSFGEAAQFGIAPELVTGEARYMDGWAVAWSSVYLRLSQEMKIMAAQKYGRPEIEEAARMESEPTSIPTPITCLTISIPDWASPDAVTYVIPVRDAKALIAALQKASMEAQKAQSKREKQIDALYRTLNPQEPDTRTFCAVEGCSHDRRFFDRDGNGYCKRHAEELGIRPKGKVI